MSAAPVFHEISSVEDARNYIMEIVGQVEQARNDCDVIIPGDEQATVAWQRKKYREFMIRHGQALGSLTTLMHCRKLNEVAYEELRRRIMQALVPTVVGATDGAQRG